MAKKKKQLYKLSFDGINAAEFTTKVQSIGRGNGRSSFFVSGAVSPATLLHTGFQWMNALESTGRVELRIIRDDDKGTRHIHVYGGDEEFRDEMELESYYTIKGSEDKIFFELEQLENGKWKMTHSLGILPQMITGARAIVLETI